MNNTLRLLNLCPRRLPRSSALSFSSSGLVTRSLAIASRGSGAPPQDVHDLVEPTPERRLRNAFEDHWMMFYRFPGDAYYR